MSIGSRILLSASPLDDALLKIFSGREGKTDTYFYQVGSSKLRYMCCCNCTSIGLSVIAAVFALGDIWHQSFACFCVLE